VKALSPEDDAKNKAAAAKVSYVLPWMVNVVTQSLPYLADREMIKKTLEECKGNIDTAVSILLDAEERASVSSQPGSSCTERDPDSDEEEFTGPNKKQDRRMSRATKALRKEKAEQEKKDIIPQATAVAKAESTPVIEITPPSIELPVRPHKPSKHRSVPRKPKSEDDDEWATPSDDDGDDDFHPDLDDVDDEVASNCSESSRSQPRALPSIVPKPLHITIHTAKTYQKQPGPQRKRQTARDRIEMKKAAQKAARKESKRQGAQASRQLEVTSVNVNKSPPIDLGMGIKTLYI
jgi:OTU domain-containing protein 3